MQAFLLSLQKALIPYKALITKLFFALELVWSVMWLIGGYVSFTQPELAFDIYEFGRRMGEVALVFYLLTLIPGILSRIQQPPWTLAGVIIQPYRRHLGIMTFLSAFIHMSFTIGFPALVDGRLPVIIGSPKLYGIVALSILFPMWITSNDMSQKMMGKKWKLMHRLTYVALLMIFLHLALFRKRWLIPTLVVLGAELFSWLLVWIRKRQTPTPPPSESAILNS
jgi:DMSO/TMAO reductase YedYZ heme-binding membrane subunit